MGVHPLGAAGEWGRIRPGERGASGAPGESSRLGLLTLRLVAGAIALCLAACASRPDARVLDPVSAVGGAKQVTVYVATTREPAPGGGAAFTDGRSRKLHYARYVISIPPTHKPGAIEWPKSKPDAAKEFVTVSATPLTETEFLAQTRAAAARSRGPRAGIGVFVHGYNYTFQESLFRLAQMDADADVGGAAVLFAWPSRGSLASYVADKESVTYSRDGLAYVIEALATQPGAENVTLLGHSMGGWLTVEAIRQLRLEGRDRAVARLGDVILAAPDIDIDVFRQQLLVVGRLSPPITLLVSKDDRALSASRFLAGDRDRVGALDIQDPQVQEVARSENLRVVDISQLQSENGTNHDRYAALATIYPQLQSQLEAGSGNAAQQAGIFVLDAAAATLQTPFRAAGAILGQR